MKILAALVAPPHLTASGGVRAGRRLSEALATRCDVTIASMSPLDCTSNTLAVEVAVNVSLPIPLRRMPPKYRSLFYQSDIPALVRRGDWDLVHIHNPMPGLEMARIAAACLSAHIPYVISTHGFNEVANGERIYRFGFARRLIWRLAMTRPVVRAVRGAAAIFVLSEADVPIVRRFGFTGDIVTVPNGIAMPPAPNPEADRAVWQRFDVTPPDMCEGPTCMFLGNHTPNKGVPVLLDAFSELDCPYQLIIGGDRRREINYFNAIPKRPDQRIIVTGRLSDAEVSALLRRTDLFVFPTRADTFPLVVLEAMAHGCAVLASDIGGISYQIDGACGELVPAGDAVALRRAVTQLAAEPRRLLAMGAAARKRAQGQFSWDAAAACAWTGYRRVVGLEAERSLRQVA
jgi:alpha-maltose-1-phosphate synthase